MNNKQKWQKRIVITTMYIWIVALGMSHFLVEPKPFITVKQFLIGFVIFYSVTVFGGLFYAITFSKGKIDWPALV